MSFRIEEKLFINNNQILEFKKFLIEKSSTELFPKREIQSLYFENNNNQMYKDSIEGTVPRKKIRIRNYIDNVDKNFYLETKISSVEGRYKKRKIIPNKEVKLIKNIGIYDDQYGNCRPLIYIKYSRQYLKFKNIRVTIDDNIEYKSFFGRELNKDYIQVVEIKASINEDRDQILKEFPFQIIRFSKYCNGFQKL